MAGFLNRKSSGKITPISGQLSATSHEAHIVRHLEPSATRGSESVSGTAQWLEAVLKHLTSGTESLRIAIPFAPDKPVSIIVTLRQQNAEAVGTRRQELEPCIDAALAAAFPTARGIAPTKADSGEVTLDNAVEVRPESQTVDADSFTSIGLRVVPNAETAGGDVVHGVSVPRELSRRPDLLALGQLMERQELSGIMVILEIERFERDARLKHILSSTYRPLSNALSNLSAVELAAKDGFGRALYAHLAWLNASACQRVTAWVKSPAPLPGILLEMVCLALYGVPLGDPPPADSCDLSRAWPDCNLAWLERLPAMLSAKQRLAQRARMSATLTEGLRLGRLEGGSALHLSAKARAQHTFVMGQTGTGKSTHIANLVAQDMEAGEAVIVFDAHGDLAEDCRRLVPARRKSDLVYLHPSDPAGRFTLNVFETLGQSAAIEQNRVANDLINLFKRIYPEPKEAYGPMFMSYTRNAIFLLLDARGKQATILDLARVFADDAFRKELIKSCKRQDVRQFWGDIAEDVSSYGDNANIDNVAPFVVAKLTQLSGNEMMRPIIGATTSSIDFRDVVANKRICIVNLALPEIGDEDAKILGGLLFARLTASLQVQAKTAPKARMPLRVYLDEVQTYADETLAQSMAQMRKFGLSYTLACQHFAQVDGGGWRPDVGRAVLGNAANLVLFRLGYFDAHMLAPYMAPGLTPQDLMRVPNFQAAARLLNADGQPIDPLVFETDPPRN